MRSLSKEAERKLINAIEKAAALVNSGDKPTDAIIKSAREHDIPAGHVNLMVHAYNTGRTTTQREKGENTLEKAAEFPLADANDVLKALYPETVKSSSAIKRAEVVSTEYALPVAGMLARRRDEMQKAAAAQVALPEKTWTPPPRDEHAAVMRAQSEKIAAQRAEEETRRQATVSYSKAAAALDDLSVYFRTPGNMSFGDALREVNLRLGPQGVSVLEKVAAVYPHFSKQADTKQNHFGDNAVYGLVQNVLDAVSDYNSAQEKLPVKKSEAVCKKTAPKFLTGSILAEEPPLELKEAAKKKKPGEIQTWHAPGTEVSGKPVGQTPPPPPSVPELPANQKIEELGNRLQNVNSPDYDPGPTPLFDAEIADADKNRWIEGDESLHRRLESNLGYRGDELSAEELKRQVDSRAAGNRTRQEAFEFEEKTREEKQRLADEERQQKEKEDSLFNRDQQERKTREEELDAVEKIRALKKKHQEEQTAGRQKIWDKGKGIGENLGKAFKGDFMGAATTPTKVIGGLLGAKSLADLSPIQKKDPNKILREQYNQLTDPSHENALKTIRAKSILHDMVLNDPVISGYDSQDVAMAFNEIAELAPSLVDAPGMIRPLLRKRLESGQLADFDVKQILDMDKLRADRDKALMDTKEKTLNLL